MAGAAPGTGSGAQAFASSLTDLMTSLAVIFILLLVVFLKQAHDHAQRAKEEISGQLAALLHEKDLALRQDPEDPLTLSVMVGENQLRFALGSSTLSSPGRGFVDTFFSHFATKICDPSLRDKVDGILIEGHTDTSGERTAEGVRNNISLSQRRSYAVLERALRSVRADSETHECLLKLAAATGRGSRNPLLTDGSYDADQSRRVEIRIRVRSAEQLFKRLIHGD